MLFFSGKIPRMIDSQLTPVWSAELNALVNDVPCEINWSILGVLQDLCSPNMVSALNESKRIKKILGFTHKISH